MSTTTPSMRCATAERIGRIALSTPRRRNATRRLRAPSPTATSISKAAPPTTSASSSRSTARPHPRCTTWSTTQRRARTSSANNTRDWSTSRRARCAASNTRHATSTRCSATSPFRRAPRKRTCRWWCCRTADRSRTTTPYFDWWSQFLASRGYAVFRPQFRGSTGLGDAHRYAGRGQWGLRMQDDVTDGVKALIAQGIVDPKRVGIVGASYGGYAALAGAAFTPDLYACAVSVAGVSDLPEMLAWNEKMSGEESDGFLLLARFDRRFAGLAHRGEIAGALGAHHSRAHPAAARDQRLGGAVRAIRDDGQCAQGRRQAVPVHTARGRGSLAVVERHAHPHAVGNREVPGGKPRKTSQANERSRGFPRNLLPRCAAPCMLAQLLRGRPVSTWVANRERRTEGVRTS